MLRLHNFYDNHDDESFSMIVLIIIKFRSENSVLEAGTRLISIDDCEITREMHEEVVEMLNNCGERVNLRIQRPRSSKALNIVENEFAELRIVQICRLALGLGFNIVGGEMDNQGRSRRFLAVEEKVRFRNFHLISSPNWRGRIDWQNQRRRPNNCRQ
jgi:hypothetical protein